MAPELDIVHLLVRSSADINAKGQLDRSPLHMAVSATSGPVVDALVSARAEVSIQHDKGDTPLQLVLAYLAYTGPMSV
ncbi:hypothetical protein G647_00989 [Cladophialophora carrionii CBS 160.54]|uniref:Uncharacterized protein n=1 Tax=Cladophialophora carrionii CBS 160.54 TaxID=1279043 RepID=V9DNR5_9EURO|nr:uncharacterized protein G647_00989 [Cladophialophora carrionii CBS 160.54]ETI28539.1 hypothetical protein G647_00989 [Cladophialophora carrionii CBS 160.54]